MALCEITQSQPLAQHAQWGEKDHVPLSNTATLRAVEHTLLKQRLAPKRWFGTAPENIVLCLALVSCTNS